MCYKVLICRSEEQESRAGFLGSAPASVWFFNLFPLVDLECEKWISVPLKRLRETICLSFRLPRNNGSSGWAGLINPHRHRHERGSFFFSNNNNGRSGLVIPSPLFFAITSLSIDFGPAEETAHILRVLLAVLGGDDDLIFRRRFAFGSIWMSFEEDLYFGRAFTHFRNRSGLRIAD